MYIDRMAYKERIEDNYYRQGKGNMGQGGVAHIYINLMSKYGLIPQKYYNGINYGLTYHNHAEMRSYLLPMCDNSVKLKRKIPEGLEDAVFDTYLGKVPENFGYRGKEYTPLSFYKSLGIKSEDYVEITSFTHHPFYTSFVLEIPDNWDYGRYYNVPLDDLVAIMDNAIKKGYTIAWDGDVDEKGFDFTNDVAVNTSEFHSKGKPFQKRIKEDEVTQATRQAGFDDFRTTDEHLMHITGISEDQEGVKYYITKNSWGKSRNSDGYLNMSLNYLKAKTISILVNKNAIPGKIRNKLGI
jgi:bleomycin hydrolase